MSPKKTVIVVGAGASQEAGLPTGDKLKQEIDQLLKFNRLMGGSMRDATGDHIIRKALSFSQDSGRYFEACKTIRAALPLVTSIDSFIHDRQGETEIEFCGKLAIISSILAAERRSVLYTPDTTVDFSSVENTWFSAFWKKLTEDCQKEDLEDRFSSIVLIIFNYDRCLEHFLYHAMQTYYGLSSDDAASLVSTVEIFHPYGTVGSLPWADRDAPTPFGATPRAQDLEMLAGQIKTFSERIKARYVEDIRSHVAAADTFVFLGFAYHPQNMELLRQRVDRSVKRRTRCYGTAHGFSEADRKAIKLNLMKLCSVSPYSSPPPMHMEIGNFTCEQLFRDYWLTLSFRVDGFGGGAEESDA